MGKPQNLGHLAHIVAYDTENHITVPAGITMHTNQLVASQAWVTTALGSYALSSALGSYVPTSRTITINGTTYDLSANRSWDITSMIYPAAGIPLSTGTAWGTSITNNSANWNTAYGWGNHASAGYVPGARTITINGTSYDLTANRSWTVSGTDATKLPLAGGTMTGKIFTVSTGTGTYDTAIEIRETSYVTTSQSAWGYSPALTFHWGGRYAKRFGMRSDGLFAVDDEPLALRSWVTSQGYITGSYLPLSGGTVTGDIVYSNLKFSGDQTYGLIGRNAYVDTINGRGSDPLEINYYDGGHVIIGTGSTGSKALYAGSLYDSGNRVITTSSIGSQSVSYASSANYANHLPTHYVGGAQGNPQVYFNNGIGLKAAMTGAWSVWSDTLWVNGYSGGDVPWMCALHFLRNSEPRFAISAQTQGSSSYGSVYEVITAYNIASQTVSTANNLSGFDKTNPSFAAVYANNWFRAQGDCGLYSQDYGCHFRRSTTATYGTWEMFGYNKNGYGGLNIIDPQGYWNNLMFENGSGGIYVQNGNGWSFYYSRNNNCCGLGGSSTNGWSRCSTNGTHHVAGDLYADGAVTAYSDGRAKENVSTIENALDKVLRMRGVAYNMIDDATKFRTVGFIAQEINEVVPEVVKYIDEADRYNVAYGNVSAVLVEAIKEQNTQVTAQDKKIEELTNMVSLLQETIQTLLNK